MVYGESEKEVSAYWHPPITPCSLSDVRHSSPRLLQLRTCWKYVAHIEAGGKGAGQSERFAQKFLQNEYRAVHFAGRDALLDLSGQAASGVDGDAQWAVVYHALRAGYGSQNNDERTRLLAYVRDRQATFGQGFAEDLSAYLDNVASGGRPVARSQRDGLNRYRWIVENVVARAPLATYYTDDKRVIDIVNADIETRLWHLVSCWKCSTYIFKYTPNDYHHQLSFYGYGYCFVGQWWEWPSG
jgi:hypothetical protein